MAGITCEGCGHHFPQKSKKGTVPCPHCGRPTHIPGAVVCLECDHLNQDVSYCVACGAALFRECPECDARMEVDQKACGDCGAIYADYLEEDETELRPVIYIGDIIEGVRIRVPSLLQIGVVIFAVSAFSALFRHEVRHEVMVVGILREEVILLFTSFAFFALGISWKVLRALFRRFGWPVVVAVISFMAIMLAGLVVR